MTLKKYSTDDNAIEKAQKQHVRISSTGKPFSAGKGSGKIVSKEPKYYAIQGREVGDYGRTPITKKPKTEKTSYKVGETIILREYGGQPKATIKEVGTYEDLAMNWLDDDDMEAAMQQVAEGDVKPNERAYLLHNEMTGYIVYDQVGMETLTSKTH